MNVLDDPLREIGVSSARGTLIAFAEAGKVGVVVSGKGSAVTLITPDDAEHFSRVLAKAADEARARLMPPLHPNAARADAPAGRL